MRGHYFETQVPGGSLIILSFDRSFWSLIFFIDKGQIKADTRTNWKSCYKIINTVRESNITHNDNERRVYGTCLYILENCLALVFVLFFIHIYINLSLMPTHPPTRQRTRSMSGLPFEIFHTWAHTIKCTYLHTYIKYTYTHTGILLLG